MILCDHQIRDAIQKGQISISPAPQPSQFDSTALNLRVGDDFRRWRPGLDANALTAVVDLDNVQLSDLLDLTVPIEPTDGAILIKPGAFILVRTLERIALPLKSKLAARVEGRSTLARLGLSVHITAPTIHAGFGGKIVLEMLNFGPFAIQVTPNASEVCQLTIERVSAIPSREVQTVYHEQTTPLGSPRPRSPRRQ